MCCAFYDNRYNYMWIIIYFLVECDVTFQNKTTVP